MSVTSKQPLQLPERIRVRDLLALSWPIMVSMLSYTAMSVVDTIFVGQLGTSPLAGVGLAVITGFFVMSFGNGLLAGAKVSIAQATGAGRHLLARRLAWHALVLALGMGLLACTLAPFSDGLFRVMGAGAESGAFAADYFRIRIWGAPLFFATMAANAWFHGRGDMGTPMVGTLISNAVNIALDPLLIFGWAAFPALGVRGAALATVIGFACGAAYVVARMSRDLAGVSLRLQRRVFAALWKLGCPIGVRYFLDVASFQVFAILLAWVGDVHLAAHIIVVRIISVSFLPGYAVGEATGVLTGMATGAERPEAAREAYRAGVRLGVAIMLAAAVVFVLMPELLLSVFSPAPEVLEVGRMLLLIGAGFQIFDALVMVAGGALNGAGDTRFAMWVSVSCAWFVKLPLGYVLTIVGGYGAVGAWLGLGAEIFALSGLLVFRVSGSAWLRHRAVADVAA